MITYFFIRGSKNQPYSPSRAVLTIYILCSCKRRVAVERAEHSVIALQGAWQVTFDRRTALGERGLARKTRNFGGARVQVALVLDKGVCIVLE